MALEKKTIRGVESNGMLCSAKALGLGSDHAGILELDTPAIPGTRFLEAVPVEDHQLVIDVPANRPDLLCHKGVARELAASLGATVKLPPIPPGQTDGRTGSLSARPPARQTTRGVVDGVDIRLEDPEGCPRYLAAVIRGVQVGPSPGWLAERLTSVGQRPISNVVDATNYVLFELNQPLHAFDLVKLRGPAVVIRRAKPGEKIVTLVGVERAMTAEMTAICDAERSTIVAGVMGSAESEVTASSADVVLECAYFQPTRIRRTRRALGLSSESSYRFERGIDLLGMPDAMRRGVELIIAVAGGELRAPPLDLWPEPVQEKTIFLRPERLSQLLGVPIERAEIERHLSGVGFFVAPKDGRLAVQVPGWRPDVIREVDLVEEVARLKGYDAFPDELRPYRPSAVPDAPVERAKARVREQLVRGGFLEARTLPLGPPPPDGTDAVALRNPMSAEEAPAPSCDVPPATGGAVGWVAVKRGSSDVVGSAGRLEADAPVWAAPLLGFEVRLEVAVLRPKSYQALPTQPPVERDLALVLPAEVTAAAVAEVLRRVLGPLLERLEVFDEYRGAGITPEHRSVAWHCTFRDPSRTVRERDVDGLFEQGLKVLEDELGVRRRES